MSSYEPPGPIGTTPGVTDARHAAPATDSGETRSLGEIVGDIATDLSTLVKQELELAKTEAKEQAAKAGKGAGMFGGAGVAAHLMLISLTFTLIWLLDNWMPLPLAALILTIVWAAIAGVLALRGRDEFRRMTPPLETTQQTLKEDVEWAKAPRNS
jgi:uncharacterized membrane protein YqjE